MTKSSAMRSGGRILVDQLRVHGVDTAFCVPGESYLDVIKGHLKSEVSLTKSSFTVLPEKRNESPPFPSPSPG